jgi:hypothetical protein
MTANVESDYETMRTRRTQYHSAGQVFDAVDTLSAIRTGIMRDSGRGFKPVADAIRAALPGDGTTPERFARLAEEIGEREAWTLVYAAAWAAVDPRVEAQPCQKCNGGGDGGEA